MSGDIEKLRWYRGPWQWDSTDKSMPHWRAPSGAVGAVDLRSIPDQSAAGTSAGLGLFVSYDALPSEYDLLGVGSPRDVKPGQKIKDAIPKRSAFSLQGDDLLTMLRSCLMDGSDPTGDSYAKPIIPGADMRFGFCCGPWQDWERTAPWNAHWHKVQDVLRADFKVCFDDAVAGRLKDREHHRRVLDAMCEKYRVDDWRAFVPLALRREIPGRLTHATTITDTFDRADASSLGTASDGFTYTHYNFNVWTIASNQAKRPASTVGQDDCRADSDLSSSDNSAEFTMVSMTAVDSISVGPLCRVSGSAQSYYLGLDNGGASYQRLFKCVAGAYTNIGNYSGNVPNGTLMKASANGSTIDQYEGATSRISVTDTALSSGLRGGMYCNTSGSGAFDVTVNDFVYKDLAASPSILYTQLEGGTRGLNRGGWIRSGN